MVIFKTKNLQFLNKINYQDLEICDDKINFIIGASGKGKSSLLKLFNLTNLPSNGSIYYKSKLLQEYNPIALRKEVLLVGQSSYLFNKTVGDNFKEFYKYRKQTPPSEEMQKKLLELCDINFNLNKECNFISGGEKQRIFLAICLSFLPKVIMLDEPSSALDSSTRDTVMKNIIDYCKKNNIAVIIVSHDDNLVNNFAENIIEIR